MGNFAPDGMTYYVGQSFRGIGGFLYIVDLADPSNPKQLPPWQFLGDGRPHGVWLPTQAGTRLYAGQPGQFGQTPAQSSFGPDGLVILDVSDYQFRRPNPQIRIISKLFWDDQGQAEEMYPVQPSTGASTSSARTSPAARAVLGGCRGRMCPGGVPAMVIRRSSTSPTRRTLKSSPSSCSK